MPTETSVTNAKAGPIFTDTGMDVGFGQTSGKAGSVEMSSVGASPSTGKLQQRTKWRVYRNPVADEKPMYAGAEPIGLTRMHRNTAPKKC